METRTSVLELVISTTYMKKSSRDQSKVGTEECIMAKPCAGSGISRRSVVVVAPCSPALGRCVENLQRQLVGGPGTATITTFRMRDATRRYPPFMDPKGLPATTGIATASRNTAMLLSRALSGTGPKPGYATAPSTDAHDHEGARYSEGQDTSPWIYQRRERWRSPFQSPATY